MFSKIVLTLLLGVIISYPLCYYEHSYEERDNTVVITMRRNYYFGSCDENVKVRRIINTDKEVKLIFSEGELKDREWRFYPY